MKRIFLILIGVLATLLIVAAIMPKDFKIEKEIVINKSTTQVFDYVKIMKNSSEWNPWLKQDPNIVQEFRGEDGKIGFVHAWSGNSEVGVGEAEIINIIPNEIINVELRFSKPMQVTNQAYYIFEVLDKEHTKVKWGMSGKTPFPFNLICFFKRGEVEKNFEAGLNNLKTVLER